MANWKFSFFFLLVSLLGAALAVPDNVYRADQRDPNAIRTSRGFKSRGSDQGISLIEHVSKVYGKGHSPMRDPWISTSEREDIGKLPTVSKPCWVYVIDTKDIANRFESADGAFQKEGKENPHKDEKEWAAKLDIPQTSIKEFYRMWNDKGTLKRSKVYTWDTWAQREQENDGQDGNGKGKGGKGGKGKGGKGKGGKGQGGKGKGGKGKGGKGQGGKGKGGKGKGGKGQGGLGKGKGTFRNGRRHQAVYVTF
ncbi:ADP-ribosylation [Canariomyces notabilis]|uniref:ADP-ribosylation n=1 Tax=Canariomyces notabilis TaxID=2074819 RepID=A0AAN6TAI9_9PEZI|nr:ADP-ribosylation [Canariomyces arenarius]